MGLVEIIVFSLLVMGVLGEDECDMSSPYTKCHHYVPRDKLDEIEVVPDREELREICPDYLRYFECFTDHLDDCGKMNEHYTVVDFIEGSHEIAKELCDESSELHQGYVDNANCYKTLKKSGDICTDEAKTIYETYYEYLRTEHPERLDSVYKSSQKNCMIQSYKTACISEKILKECGESAQDTFMQIVSKAQYLRQFCSQSMIEELRTAFLHQLGKESDDLEVYQSAFAAIM